MLVIAVETGPDGHVRWAGRRHDDDRSDASSGASPSELFDAVFHALHDGEQIALGFDCALTVPVPPDQEPGHDPGHDPGHEPDHDPDHEPGHDPDHEPGHDPGQDPATALAESAASRPGLAELGYLLGELGNWRPWTTVSTSLARWKANTSILVWQAVPAPGANAVTASAAADSFFRELPAAVGREAQEAEPARDAEPAGTVVNLAAAAARRAGLFVDPSELAQPTVSITVTGG